MTFDRPGDLDLTSSDPETVRRAYLRHESNVKSVGQLCYLVAFFSLLGTLEFSVFAAGIIPPPPEMKALAPPGVIRAMFWAMAAAFVVNTLAQLALGYGLIHLQAWARWTVVVLTAISLASNILTSLAACMANPAPGLMGPLIGFEIHGMILGLVSLLVGGAIHGLILYPLLTPSAGVVFSQAYREVIRKTPQIKCRMHWLLKLFIGLLLALVLGFGAFLMAIYFRLVD
jgi:hypothetical protein